MNDDSQNNILPFDSLKCFDSEEQKNNILQELRPILQEELIACDFTLCLVISAIKSLRVDQIFHPRPRFLCTGDNEDIPNLRKLCDKIPPLTDILHQQDIPFSVLKFLQWLFVNVCKTGTRLTLSQSKYPGYNPKVVQPSFIFNVEYTDQSNKEWLVRKGTKKSFYAFHGSALENFFSISQAGLKLSMCDKKYLLYGNGIYLSTDLTMCFLYSPYWSSWRNSKLKGQYSVIACCEIINDSTKVLQEGYSAKTELDGKIAKKYVVVTDPSVIRVTHFLVYEKSSNCSLWFQKHLFIVALFIYLFLLLYISLFGSQKNTLFRYVTNIINRLYEFIKSNM